MSRIHILPPDVVGKIRAGEVIDRPAAVAKELIENAIDAGSRLIAVHVGSSPDRLIRVQDDGAGMTRDDAAMSIKRHATSKLEHDSELSSIRTLGFRGEALASIAEVSRLTLSTRSAEDLTGTQVEVLGGTTIQVSGVGRATGTTVTVEDLFFNTPARLRFLKSRESETRALSRVVWSYIFTLPGIHWRFLIEGREDVDLPPAADFLERWSLVYGRGAAAGVEGSVSFEGEIAGVRVRGVLGTPEQARANRDHQFFAVNGRVVSSPTLGAALRQGYGNLIPSDRYPIGLLLIELDPSLVDVNVHPTKREVRFRDESRVFQATRAAVEEAMRRYVPVGVALGSGTGSAGRPFAGVDATSPSSSEGFPAAPSASQPLLDGLEIARALYAPPESLGSDVAREGETGDLREHLAEPEIAIWQLHDRYLLAPIRGGLVIVDQHAAHERILYEEARERLFGAAGPTQHLLFPRVLDLTRDELDMLLLHEPQLKRLGYEVALFGERQIAVRGVPAAIPEEAAIQALKRVLLGAEDADASGDPPEERLAKTFACHAAVRSGQPLKPVERRALVDRLFATELPHGDPHGRATYVRVSMEELDRRFGRR
ncbi:MAG: DNA mismatch repair endonuclease MutL [Candidatus Eisenbacteria bacterium]